jgi:hypothetical protein
VADVVFDRLTGVAHRAAATPGVAECGHSLGSWLEAASMEVLAGSLAKVEEQLAGQCSVCFSLPEPAELTVAGPFSPELAAQMAAGVKADRRAAAKELAEMERESTERAYMPANLTVTLAERLEEFRQADRVQAIIDAREEYRALKALDQVDPKQAELARRRWEYKRRREQLAVEYEAEQKAEEDRQKQSKVRKLAAIITGKK